METALTITELLTLDAHSLQKRLEARTLTSVELVDSCLAQIESHDRNGVQLRAITAIAPLDKLRERAQQLDNDRASGHVKSSLHGIPILVKDCIATSPRYGLKTSVGSLALKDSFPRKTSKVVDKV
ncbi:uncharacterized protein KY384_005761 [Bacidia gigantensis]|uniref:uncharacterized protein n=1 Tax=Bacidia gigantensis TaxID=2732470 RepID=UPI001D03B3EC|nr:uncharacterized protein KY384_005761 [Bacidia gigantensis]KAG8529126.1 hypothetical protein KY384_005761 [Bacidia gigantensis]